MIKLYKTVNYLIASMFLSPLTGLGQEINIGTGTQLVMDGGINLVLTDAGFTNNGTLAAQGGTVAFKGSAASAASFIGGSSPTLFNNLSINKADNHVTLNSNIGVKGNLNLLSNNLLLNSKEIDLGTSGLLAGESAASRIAGDNGGYVKAQANLNAPSGANPGNLGLQISSTANMGTTTIKRSHVETVLNTGNSSIKRYYDIIPTNNTNLSAVLRFNYQDAELDAINENDLILWSSENNGASWTPLGKEQINTTSNVIKYGILNSLGRITAGTANAVLSVDWTSFTAQAENGKVLLKWSTASETSNDRFEVYRSANQTDFELVTVVKGNGTNSKSNSYSAFDNFPLGGTSYYKIKQIDQNGTSSFSEIRIVKSLSESFVKAYPNPTGSLLNLLFTSNEAGRTDLQLYNTAGLLVASRTENIESGINKIEWPLNAVPGGTYLIRFGKLNIAPVKIVKQ